MGKKRKRPVKHHSVIDAPTTCPQSGPSSRTTKADDNFPSHPVITLYYNRVVTLRRYLLDQLPVSSKLRRRRLATVGIPRPGNAIDASVADTASLAHLLDTTWIGVLKETTPTVNDARKEEFAAFSQSETSASILASDAGPPSAQVEIVNFVILTLFNRIGHSSYKPQHLLTQGYQRASGYSAAGQEQGALSSSIPGVVAHHPNSNVSALKQAPWTEIVGLLGSNGEEIMIRLLLDCGIFTCVDVRKRIYHQISGTPLSILRHLDKPAVAAKSVDNSVAPPKVDDRRHIKPLDSRNLTAPRQPLHKPNSIVFVRRRMFYARPILNAQRKVRFGLEHRHVLNRYPSPESLDQTVHVMQYIFPRQFGLHNVFTSSPDSRETVQPFKDYVFREEEIAQANDQRQARYKGGLPDVDRERQPSPKIPKRLRSRGVDLVQKLQRRNQSCAYVELLNHYCPLEGLGPWRLEATDSQPNTQSATNELGSLSAEALVTQVETAFPQPSCSTPVHDGEPVDGGCQKSAMSPRKMTLTDYATSLAAVSAFCRAVLQRLIPPEFYGIGEDGAANRRRIFTHVDGFIRMRRFESLSLHEVCTGLKVTCIPWLDPAHREGEKGGRCSQRKISMSDLQKRTELLHEFVYYVFDSILIPLIRTNFYVTESQVHRNRLFYFRHDVWHQLTETPLLDLKSSMFEELKTDQAQRILARRPFGCGAMRLLPKSAGLRPILNLRRRIAKRSMRGDGRGAVYLEPSVNSIMTPVYNVLKFEKDRDPERVGAALGSVGEIHQRLRQFKEGLLARQAREGTWLRKQVLNEPLFFVKLDIQSCFDTIPQDRLVRLIEDLVSEEAYHVAKHVEIRPNSDPTKSWPSMHAVGPRFANSKPTRRFIGRAAPTNKPSQLSDLIASGATSTKADTVLVDTLAHRNFSSDHLLDLLNEHVRNNLVKIGKKYFRQRNGIPQGSVLSSLLCNFFYGKLEREVLGFVTNTTSTTNTEPGQGGRASLLLRLIDDFLLITTRADLALRFLHVMLPGQPDYGISVNASKSLTNFSVSVNGVRVPRLMGTTTFPYCGILIHTHTLEVFRDQSRVLDLTLTSPSAISTTTPATANATSILNALTITTTTTPGRTFHRKFLAAFQLNFHPMYIDTSHNSLHTVLANVYASFVTTGIKMYRYLRVLDRRPRVNRLRRRRGLSVRRDAGGGGGGGGDGMQEVLIRTIQDLIQLADGLVRKTRRSNSDRTTSSTTTTTTTTTTLSSGGGKGCKITIFQIHRLAISAFYFVLRQKQTRYGRVLRWLARSLQDSNTKGTIGGGGGGGGKSEMAMLTRVIRDGDRVFGQCRF